MLNKISEAQRLMLRAAATREDRLVTPLANARVAAIKILGDKLIDAGWAKKIKARNGEPVWRKDREGGETYALRLTAKGLKAAAQTSARRSASALEAPASTRDDLHSEASPTPTRAPRPNSKLGRVLGMLVADAGAIIGDLTAATGWLEHTTRAALTGLRRRGYELSLTRKERDGASVYRIVAHSEAVAQ